MDRTFSQSFTPQFQAMRSELETKIEAVKISSSISSDALRQLSVCLAQLTKALGDATGIIPSYDQKQYENQLKSLEDDIESLRSSIPKSKFSFKRKQALAQSQTASNDSVHESTPKPNIIPTLPTAANSLVISSRSNAYLPTSFPLNNNDPCDVSISNLDSCVIDFIGKTEVETPKISALQGRNLTKCVLYLPLIQGSVLLHDLKQCIIVLGCHQFRMHSSTDVDVFLDISSNPIIENCQTLRFTRYITDLLPTVRKKVKDSQDHHFFVQDFSHIRSTPSPNFSIQGAEETRVLEEKLVSLREKGVVALANIFAFTTPP